MSGKIALKELAYYGTGGIAKKLYQPETTAELQSAMKKISQLGLEFFYLGGGTNSLVTDETWDGAVVSFGKLQKVELLSGDRIRFGAGVENSHASTVACDHGLEGIAWMNGLPGQLGGTVRMNARCYGGEISEVVEEVKTVTSAGELKTYRDPKVFRGYKDTVFMENNEAIAEVVISLTKGDPAKIRAFMDDCLNDRTSKGQYVHPTCGCVFKNNYDVGVPSGMLIEQTGLKGYKGLGTEINPHHANFVYNLNASSRDIIETTFLMREKVYERFGVWMDYEMEILGRLPEDLAMKVNEKRDSDLSNPKLVALRDKFQGKK